MPSKYVADKLLHRTQSDVFTTDPPIHVLSGAIQDPHGDLEKHSIFKRVSKAAKIRKSIPQVSSKKHQKSALQLGKKLFLRKHVFQYFQYENLVLRPLAVNYEDVE